MGGCCQKLENIDHVNSLNDLRFIVSNDINLYTYQNKLIGEERNLGSAEMKDKKIEYFNYLIQNLNIVKKDLNDIKSLKNEDIQIFKQRYKIITNEISTFNLSKIEKAFENIHNLLESYNVRKTIDKINYSTPY